MDARDAAKLAFKYVIELLESERITNLGLEEVEYDPDTNEWVITIGFSRPWDHTTNALAMLAAQGSVPRRSYKVLRINSNTQQVLSMKNREVKQ